MSNEFGERIARMEQKTDDMDKKIDRVLDKLDGLDSQFLTRHEWSVAKWLIGLGFTLLGACLGVIEFFRG